jgi:hypothetical protein
VSWTWPIARATIPSRRPLLLHYGKQPSMSVQRLDSFYGRLIAMELFVNRIHLSICCNASCETTLLYLRPNAPICAEMRSHLNEPERAVFVMPCLRPFFKTSVTYRYDMVRYRYGDKGHRLRTGTIFKGATLAFVEMSRANSGAPFSDER